MFVCDLCDDEGAAAGSPETVPGFGGVEVAEGHEALLGLHCQLTHGVQVE